MKTKTLCIALMISAGILGVGCDKLGKKDDAKGDSSSSADDKDSKSDKDSKKKKDGKESVASASASGTATPTPAMPSATDAAAAKAAAHLPSDCEAAVHFQVSRLMTNPSLTKEVVPLIDKIIATPAPKDKDFKQFQGFLTDTSIDPKKDVQDVAVCITDLEKSASWAVAIGGNFKPDTIIPALQKHNEGKNKLNPQDIGGLKGLADNKSRMVQVADGTFLASESEDLIKKLIPTGGGASALHLDLGKDLSFAINEAGTKAAFASGKRAPDEMKAVRHAEGFIDLSSGKANIRLATDSGDAAKKLDALITLMKSQFEKQAAANQFGEGDALKGTTSRIDGNDVLIETALPPGVLDKAASAIATQLKQAQAKL